MVRVQKSDRSTSASFQPLAVLPAVFRKPPLKRPGRAPLSSRWGASAEPPPVCDPASPPEFELVLRLEEGLPALKHRRMETTTEHTEDTERVPKPLKKSYAKAQRREGSETLRSLRLCVRQIVFRRVLKTTEDTESTERGCLDKPLCSSVPSVVNTKALASTTEHTEGSRTGRSAGWSREYVVHAVGGRSAR